MYSNRRELAGFYDLAMWIEVPGEVRLARGVARDGEAMRQRSLREWMPSEDRYRVEHSPDARADLVIDGTSSVSVAGRPGFIVLGEGPDACWEP